MNNFPNKPTPYIQKTVPVKKNGFILELQVAPPGQANQGLNQSTNQSSGSIQAQSSSQQFSQNPQFQAQNAFSQQAQSQAAYNQTTPQFNQANNELPEEKKQGIMPSLRDFFNR
jgi:hypothetical protein